MPHRVMCPISIQSPLMRSRPPRCLAASGCQLVPDESRVVGYEPRMPVDAMLMSGMFISVFGGGDVLPGTGPLEGGISIPGIDSICAALGEEIASKPTRRERMKRIATLAI